MHCAPLAHKAYNTEQIGTVRAVISVFNTREDVSFFANAVNKLSINSLKVNKK